MTITLNLCYNTNMKKLISILIMTLLITANTNPVTDTYAPVWCYVGCGRLEDECVCEKKSPPTRVTINDALQMLRYIAKLPSDYDNRPASPVLDDVMRIFRFLRPNLTP